jgi:hypothetical protein
MATERPLRDCPNHNLSRMQDSSRTISTSAGWSRGVVGGGGGGGEEGEEEEKKSDRARMVRMDRINRELEICISQGQRPSSQRISLRCPRRRTGRDMPCD